MTEQLFNEADEEGRGLLDAHGELLEHQREAVGCPKIQLMNTVLQTRSVNEYSIGDSVSESVRYYKISR